MKVTALEYRRVKSDGKFGSHGYQITAEVGPGEDPEEALDELQRLVARRLSGADEKEAKYTAEALDERTRERADVGRLRTPRGVGKKLAASTAGRWCLVCEKPACPACETAHATNILIAKSKSEGPPW